MKTKALSIILLTILPLTLTSCAKEITPTKKDKAPKKIQSRVIPLYPPTSCVDTKVYTLIKKEMPNYKFIDTDFTPAPDTELFQSISSGGLACTFGDLSSETGIQILFTPTSPDEFIQKEKTFLNSEYTKIDSEEYLSYLKLKENLTSPDGKLRYGVITQKNNFYITISYNNELESQLLDKIILNSWESMSTENSLGDTLNQTCYLYENNGGATFSLDIIQTQYNQVIASLFYNYKDKDNVSGTFEGILTNQVLKGIYTYQSEGAQSKEEIFFKYDQSRNSFLQGIGKKDLIENIFSYTRPLKLDYNKGIEFRYQPCPTE